MVSPRHVEAGCQLMWKMMKTAEFFSCCVYTINEAGGIWRGGLWDAGKVLQMLESGGRQDPVPLGLREASTGFNSGTLATGRCL